MYTNRIKATVKGLLSLCGFLLTGALAAIILAVNQPLPEPPPKEQTEQYRFQGLYEASQLSSAPICYDGNMAVFSDRVLRIEKIDDTLLNDRIEGIKTLLDRAKAQGINANTYVIMVPDRIAFEEPFSDDALFLMKVRNQKKHYKAVEEQLIKKLRNVAVPVPIFDTLQKHREDYIFYRTTSDWTALGAYYGSQAFLQAAGKEPFPLESFYEYTNRKFSGIKSGISKYYKPGQRPYDRLYYYLYQDYNPIGVQIDKNGSQRRMISLTRSDKNTFLGESYHLYQVPGMAKNGQNIMLIGESNAHILAPWLVTQYENILCMDVDDCVSAKWGFLTIMKEHQITDLLIVEDTASLLNEWKSKTFQWAIPEPDDLQKEG